MAKKKVLYVITKSNWGGAQRYVFDLATNLSKEEFEVAVALGGTGAKDAGAGELETRLKANGVRTMFVSSFMRDVSLLKEWRTFKELYSLFKKEMPDVVHLNSSKAGALGALAAKIAGIKKILFTSHGLAWEEDRNALAKAAIYLLTWVTFLLSNTVITITTANFKRASRLLFCKHKIKQVYNGIAQEAYLSKEEARVKLNISPDAFVVGGIGELTWNKGWHYLLRAAGISKHDELNYRLAIIGAGEEKVFLQTIIEEENIGGRASLLGFIPDASTYIKAFDIFVLASVKEGLPYVLLEAGQAGVPIVATDVGGVSDIVGNAVSGLLVKPKVPHELAAAIKKLYESPEMRLQFSQALQKRVTETFTLSNMVSGTEELYRTEVK